MKRELGKEGTRDETGDLEESRSAGGVIMYGFENSGEGESA